MSKGKFIVKKRRNGGNILFWTVGSLLMLTMLSTWFVSGLFEKYVVSDNNDDSERVAMTGVKIF